MFSTYFFTSNLALLAAGRCPFRAWQQDVATRALGPGMDRVRGEDGVPPRIMSKLSWRCGLVLHTGAQYEGIEVPFANLYIGGYDRLVAGKKH